MGLQVPCGLDSQMEAEGIIRRAPEAFGASVQDACSTKREQNTGRPPDGGPCPHADLDSAKVWGLTGCWLYQRQECYPHRQGLPGAKKELHRTELLGQRLLRIHGGQRRRSHPAIHQEATGRRQTPGSTENVLTVATYRWLMVYNRFERSMVFQASGFAGGV